MIKLRRPTPDAIDRYRTVRLEASPTCTPGHNLSGFRHERFSREIGEGDIAFERACRGLMAWAAHRGAGVEVFPATAEVTTGETVAILTQQLGLWVLAACRVDAVVDRPNEFGFTYLTLPDHPECGYESFFVRLVDGQVHFDIEAISKPGILIVRLGAPLTRRLQRRATNSYLEALAQWVLNDGPNH
jgi:uncharacterized protein (UPF0548 family)